MLDQPANLVIMKRLAWWTKGRAVDVDYVNYSKAFDTASRNIILNKLTKCRLENRTVKLIVSWLNNWAQRVCISSRKSSWRQAISGVPWESILGQILFYIFVNHLNDRTEENSASLKMTQNWEVSLICQMVSITIQKDLD